MIQDSFSLRFQSERAAVIEEALSWLRTPFHHGQALKGVGVDCANFIIAVYIATGMVDPYTPDYYSPDWFLHEETPRVPDAIKRDFLPTDNPMPGDVALFRFGRAIAHIGIILEWPTIIHADRMIGMVSEDSCGPHTTLAIRLAGTWTLRRWTLSNE